jgi:DNA-binding NtrC family response regulator
MQHTSAARPSATLRKIRARNGDLRTTLTKNRLQRHPLTTEAFEALLSARFAAQRPGGEELDQATVIMAQSGWRTTAADLDLASLAAPASTLTLRAVRNDAERWVVIEALRRSLGNISQAAKAIRISRPAFHELLAKHKIRAEAYKAEGKPKS